MKLYSTKNKAKLVELKEAVLRGLPEDKGLYMPEKIPVLPEKFLKNLSGYTFEEIALEVTGALFQEAIPRNDLIDIIQKAINFPAPLVRFDHQISVLELFHGPSLSFKDFGARFMAQLMSYFNREEKKELVILVATSGDTGGAVAAGFYQTPGIRVVILYPSGKVSMLQEKQLTTLGHNISALEIKGTFDDCQALVKQAFIDPELRAAIRMSSANSINIARLIPQTFYYFEAFKQLKDHSRPVAISVPSGNFGNLTAGLMAKKMGLPVHHFIAATNINDVVPVYLRSGIYTPRPSVRTLSNAMDVGNPSNFDRMIELFSAEMPDKSGKCSTWNMLKKELSGYTFNDEETKKAIREVYNKYRYIIDPHGAVSYLALKEYLNIHTHHQGILLETAHPSKFMDEVETILGKKIAIPGKLAVLVNKEKKAVLINNDYLVFKNWLLGHLVQG